MEERRPRAFAVAYGMLGSVSEAEDIVQEALLRRHHLLQQGEPIESPRAFSPSLDRGHPGCASTSWDQVRRESYVGEWLPEPLVDEAVPEHVAP